MRAILLVATFLALSSPALTAEPYIIDGKPIATACLLGFGNHERNPINLDHCGHPELALDDVTRTGDMIGFTYHDAGESAGYGNQGYFYYRFVGHADGDDVLLLRFWTGGTEHYNRLIGVKRDGDMLELVREYAIGDDRCDGSVTAATVTNGQLRFDVLATPSGLFAVTDKNHQVVRPDGLDDYPNSCTAVIHFVAGEWTGATLTPDKPGQSALAKAPQHCFDALREEYITRGKRELDRDSVLDFEKTYTMRCGTLVK